jgi:hypothetical protein
MIATLTAYDIGEMMTHSDTRVYPNLSLLWEHIGCQQNNRRSARVRVQTDTGVTYEVQFSPWTPNRRFVPSNRFRQLLNEWCAKVDQDKQGIPGLL